MMKKNSIENPYLNQRMINSSVVEAVAGDRKNWVIFSFISLFVALIAVAGVVYMGTRSHIKPVVIETDGKGKPIRAYTVSESADPADPRIIKAELSEVMASIRTVSYDANLQKKTLEDAIFFFETGSPGFQRVQEYLTDDETNPFKRAEKELVDVQVNNVIAIDNNVWEIQWTEYVRGRDGRLRQTKKFKGIANIRFAEKITEDIVLKNPIGIVIYDLVWSEYIS